MDGHITRTSRDEELEELRERVAELERRLEQREQGDYATRGDGDGPISRRRLLGLAGAAGVNPVELGETGQDAGGAETGITSTSGTTTFRAANTDGVAVTGNSINATGVLGVSSTSNSIVAHNPDANSNGAQLRLNPGTIAGPPTGGAHTLGQFWMDSAGELLQCVVAGTPGTWVRQRPFVPAQAPVRAYDSRPGEEPLGGVKGPLNPGEERTVNLFGAVPPFASAVLCNLSVVNTVNAGFLAMFKTGVPLAGALECQLVGVEPDHREQRDVGGQRLRG